jgi:hypothetical protein
MSDPDQGTAPPERPDVPPPRRDGWLTALMMVVGIVLLLPGLCAIVFAVAMGGGGGAGPLPGLWLLCLIISAGGIALIVKATR